MANALNWTKDRNRKLARRAAAEELEDCRSLGPLPSDATVGLKASLRAIAESIDFDRFNLLNNDPRGSWKISCSRCRAEFIAWAALSTALKTPIACPTCSRPHWLSERDVEIPWN
jgi:hypothetical protein